MQLDKLMMTKELTKNEIKQFNSLYSRGSGLQRDIVILDGRQFKKPNIFAKRKLNESIKSFKRALDIYPSSYQSMLFIGKAYQALGDLDSALLWFIKALSIEPNNPIIAKEAGGCAGHLGKHEIAIQIMKEPARIYKTDAILQCNIGLSFLFTGKISEAKNSFIEVKNQEPDNRMNNKILALVELISNNNIDCPKTEAELIKLINNINIS